MGANNNEIIHDVSISLLLRKYKIMLFTLKLLWAMKRNIFQILFNRYRRTREIVTEIKWKLSCRHRLHFLPHCHFVIRFFFSFAMIEIILIPLFSSNRLSYKSPRSCKKLQEHETCTNMLKACDLAHRTASRLALCE